MNPWIKVNEKVEFLEKQVDLLKESMDHADRKFTDDRKRWEDERSSMIQKMYQLQNSEREFKDALLMLIQKMPG